MDVLLVDGVGRPRIVSVVDPGDMIEFAHEGITDKRQHRVKFDRQFEAEFNGLAVFRMRCPGPFPRIRTEYIHDTCRADLKERP